ncbi:DUF4159 domain-containing protein, partial [Candidatus Poribacteria bacterium]|nr:DUF4159 domain-containing protein [Candidatus Poribacteria bacterium]
MRILLVFSIFTMMSISAVLPARKQENRPLSSDAFEKHDGFPARCLGVYDDYGRLMTMINFNSDLGDGWEHAAESFYPRERS